MKTFRILKVKISCKIHEDQLKDLYEFLSKNKLNIGSDYFDGKNQVVKYGNSSMCEYKNFLTINSYKDNPFHDITATLYDVVAKDFMKRFKGKL